MLLFDRITKRNTYPMFFNNKSTGFSIVIHINSIYE